MSRALSSEREAMATTSVCSPFCIAGMTFCTPMWAVLNTPKRIFCIRSVLIGNLSYARSASVRHFLQGPPFGLAYGSPHKGQGQHGGHRIESISASETDGIQQGEES